MKVEELEGGLLDFWTGKAEGEKDVCLHTTMDGRKACSVLDESQYSLRATYSPSTDWSQGGPIIEREKIVWNWINTPNGCHAVCGPWELKDKSPLVAAMRYYVYRKFGKEVDDS